MQRNDVMKQNTALSTHLKAVETDLKKKDQIISKLYQEMRSLSTGSQMISSMGFNGFYPAENNSMTNTGSMLSSPPDYPGFQGPYSKQQKNGSKTQQQTKQISDYRKRIKDLKCDLSLKENEI